MPVTSFLAPGLYDGVEWTFYPDNFGRIPGFANPEFEEFDPVYIAIFLRSVKIALITVAATLLVCDPPPSMSAGCRKSGRISACC